MSKEKTYYAVCDDCAVYGIGSSEDEAMEDAKKYFHDCHENFEPEDVIRCYGNNMTNYDLYLVEISEKLFDHVKTHGGCISPENKCYFSDGIYTI